MAIFQDNEQRLVFRQTIRENIIGPGACKDIFKCSDDLSDEIINRNPVDQYYSGILFPRDRPKDEFYYEDNGDIDNDSEELIQEETEQKPEEEEEENEDNSNQPEKSWQLKYYPNHMGLIFCVSGEEKKIKAQVTYAKYNKIKLSDGVKVKFGRSNQEYTENKTRLTSLLIKFDQQNCYEKFQNLTCRLSECIEFDDNDCTIFLTALPTITVVEEGEPKNICFARKDIASLYKTFKSIPGIEIEKTYDFLISRLSFLFEASYFRREKHFADLEIDVSQENQEKCLESFHDNKDLYYNLKIFTRTKEGKRKKYVKLVIQNRNPWNKKNEEGTDNRGWRLRSLFQPEIRVLSNNFTDYKEFIGNAVDEENSVTEYLYRDERAYGKGIGCSIMWDDEGEVKELRSSYMPEVYSRDFSNKPNAELLENSEVFNLKNISIWSDWSHEEIIKKLNDFAESYVKWCSQQRADAVRQPEYENIYNGILEKQKILSRRLEENIKFLENISNGAMECFRIANTAMYIQMLIARHPKFLKNRNLIDIGTESFDSLDFFKDFKPDPDDPGTEPKYRPFQLAFLLMNIKSITEQQDVFRENVDLIWFPTGGGKTEAYLALTAFTIITRRRKKQMTNTKGVSVIMRYTLRLLTAQQFERATYLICALEFLRQKRSDLGLGGDDNRISIGMWVGGETTPNRVSELAAVDPPNKFSGYIDSINQVIPEEETEKLQGRNPFPISYCPWCGCKLVTWSEGLIKGYDKKGNIKCCNLKCHFSSDENRLPVYYIDDLIYSNQPTLLFGTVDKFANLTNKEGHRLFNCHPDENGEPPDLIIQDELHLISGPLGSMVGFFESLIEMMSTKKNRKPKIVASTATIRNTRFLIRQLYNREVFAFPPQGIRFSDNFFSQVDLKSQKRLHIGIIPFGHTAAMTEIRLIALLLLSRMKLFIKYLEERNISEIHDPEVLLMNCTNNNKLNLGLDDFWTMVLFYNSLKDLGRTKSRISQEIYETLRAFLNYADYPDSMRFLIENFYGRVSEFTSREHSSRIKALLTKAESKQELVFEDQKISCSEGMDLMMASNMISVGIDISRLNVMLFAGQPRSVSEYIQSSSRVARERRGLVFNLLNSNRIRELSLLENFRAFHKVYYKYVEPLSATPYTEATVDRLLINIMVCFARHIKNLEYNQIRQECFSPLIQFLQDRCQDENQKNYVEEKIHFLAQKWIDLVNQGEITTYEYFNKNDEPMLENMKSLRIIEPDCYSKIHSINYSKRN